MYDISVMLYQTMMYSGTNTQETPLRLELKLPSCTVRAKHTSVYA